MISSEYRDILSFLCKAESIIKSELINAISGKFQSEAEEFYIKSPDEKHKFFFYWGKTYGMIFIRQIKKLFMG